MTSKLWKKYAALFLALMMILSISCPFTAWAEEAANQPLGQLGVIEENTAFTEADEATMQADKSTLQKTISDANTDKGSVVVSVYGTDAEAEDKWVGRLETDANVQAINQEEENFEINEAVTWPEDALAKLVSHYLEHPPMNPSGDWETFVGLWGAGEDLSAPPWPSYQWKTQDLGYDHIHYIFSLLATGENPAKAFETERNLFAELASRQNQDNGSFGDLGKHIFAIIALDVGTELGVDVGAWDEETRSKAVDYLLSQQNNDGSFGPYSQIDYTGWALIALSKSKDTHAVAINKAKQYLKSMQQDSGGFGGTGWDAENCISIACAIQGLIAIGEDISSADGPWGKNGKTPIDALLSYQIEEGSFKWQHDDSEGNPWATKQAVVALADIVNEQSTWYKLGGIDPDHEQDGDNEPDKTALEAAKERAYAINPAKYTEESYAALLAALALPETSPEEIAAKVKAINRAIENLVLKDAVYTFNVRIEGNDRTIVPLREVSVSIADLDLSEYGVETDFTEPKPLHVIIKALENEGIDCKDGEGIKIVNYGENFILISAIDGLVADYPAGWLYCVNNHWVEKGVAEQAIDEGDTIVMFFVEDFAEYTYSWFDTEKTAIQPGQELQLTLTGSAYDALTGEIVAGPVSDAAILVNGQVYKVNGEIVKTDSAGKVTLTFSEPGTYHVTAEKKNESGVRIITRPYCLVAVEQTPGNGGDVTPQPKKYITLSVDKMTINKGYVIPPTQVELEPGDTPWAVLKRELDARNISYEYKWHAAYNTVHVQSIDGDGEFDHGPWSGWMYYVNGKSPGYGASQYLLKDGDVVEWRYTTNLGEDLGEDNSKWGPPPGSLATDITGGEIKVTNSTGTVSITDEQLNEALKSADKDGYSYISIKVETLDAVSKVTVELPKSSVASIASRKGYGLKIETPVGNLDLSNAVLGYLAKQGKGDKLTVSLKSVDTSQLTDQLRQIIGDNLAYDITVESGSRPISNFGGENITLSLPYSLREGERADDVKVWYLNDAGERQPIECTYDEKTGLATFKTSQLSCYLVGIAGEAKGEEKGDFVLKFIDVKESDWFYEAVKYAVEYGLLAGTGESTFSPHEPMTRAMLVTVLHRLEGSPEATDTNSFTDVKNDEWYTDAVIWANANHIVKGYGKGLFGPDDPITREQIAAILYNYACFKGYDLTATASLSNYTDGAAISSWALRAMSWANAKGLITGRTATTLVPGGTATRAEVAAMLQRFVCREF